MRFDFRLMDMRQLFILLAEVFDKEGKKYEDEALRAIAEAAEGSARDALSLADTCLNFSDDVLTNAQVRDILGGGGQKTIDLFDAVAATNVGQALAVLSELALMGQNMSAVLKGLISHSRDLMLAKAAPQSLSTTNQNKSMLIKKAEGFSLNQLAALLSIFSEAESHLRQATSPRMAMEILVVKAIKLFSYDPVALDLRLALLENKLEKLLKGTNDFANFDNIASFSSVANTSKTAGNNIDPSMTNTREKHSFTKKDTFVPLRSADIPPFAQQDTNIKQDTVSDAKAMLSKADFENNAYPNASNSIEQAFLQSANAVSLQKPLCLDNQGQEDAPQKALTARQLWGRIITYFRKHSGPAAIQIIGRQNPQNVSIKSGLLTIVASREDYLAMCEDSILENLARAISNENLSYRIKVEKDTADIDIEKAVNDLQRQFGKNKVNLTD
jgi:DNA polymerase III gamma/tau subunit